MEAKSYHTVDKSTWGVGPWLEEPDKKQWIDEETGYPCLIVRNPAGALCGYVGVSKSHPAHRFNYAGCSTKRAARNMRQFKKYSRKAMKLSTPEERLRLNCRSTSHHGPKKGIGEKVSSIRVHGGLTFSDKCQPRECESKGICHTVSPGEDDKIWWYGFDCSHHDDYCPKYAQEYRMFGYGTYKTEAYVISEIKDLAKQLKAIERG